MDPELVFQILLFLAFIAWQVIRVVTARKSNQDQAARLAEAGEEGWGDAEPWPDELTAAFQAPPAEPGATALNVYAERRQNLLAAYDRLIDEAENTARDARVDRATTRISNVLADYVLPHARGYQAELRSHTGPIPEHLFDRYEQLQLVVGATETFINQRRTPGLRRALGDADAIAQACYLPVINFARANLPALTSADPIAVLTPFDLATWNAFLPTGAAPLFLPRAFFTDVRWWPALAHEIGHDFLAASGDAEQSLRNELGLPGEAVGQRPLQVYGDSLHPSELVRVFGAWFEEIFCDVFGTLMMGPAYGYTMIDLFAERNAPLRVARVDSSASGRGYDIHPPRHLRVLLCCRTLELMAEDPAAETLRGEWTDIHGEQPAILFPVAGGTIPIPTPIMVQIGGNIVERLYSDGLDGLDGHSLSDIPGLEYGPHRAAEAGRARDELLSGRVPAQHRCRAVVAGAVLAWREAPAQHDQILALARRAIVGVTETRDDVYSSEEPSTLAAGTTHGVDDLREAFILHTILSPPPSLARYRRVNRGFLSRRTWP